MRLLNITTREIEEFYGNNVPKYALLSHTWGPDEVTGCEMDAIARYHRPQHESGTRSPDDPDAMKLLLSTMLLAFRGSRARFSHPSTRPALTNGHEIADDEDTGFRRLVPAPSSHPFEAKAGYQKIAYACGQAEKDGLQYLWVDTCCVDRRNGADVSEAANNAFAWGQQAAVCYAYLEDVHYSDYTEGYKTWKDHFNSSRWFKRSWTLQELLAPRKVVFYAKGWRLLGTKSSLIKSIERITGIDQLTLLDQRLVHNASVALRMSWAASRTTTRTEDVAYSLLGIFGINMPILYGEGENAFLRLQEEIIKRSDDQSIFAWGLLNHSGSHLPHHHSPPDLDDIDPNDDDLTNTTGILAKSPADFAGAGHILPTPPPEAQPATHHALTNKGLLIHLPFLPPNPTQPASSHLAVLSCRPADSPSSRLALVLTATRTPNVFLRTLTAAGEATTMVSASDLPPSTSPPPPPQLIYIPTTTTAPTNPPPNSNSSGPAEVIFIRFPDLIPPGYAVTSLQGQNAQWNREAGKLRVTGGHGKGVLWQVAVVAFWNRHLACGLIVRILTEGRGGTVTRRGVGKRGRVFVDVVYGGPGEEAGLAVMARRVWENPGSVEVAVPHETPEDAAWAGRTDWVRVATVREGEGQEGAETAGGDGPPFRPGCEPNLCGNVTFTERWEREYQRTVTVRVERRKKGAIEVSLASVLWQSPGVE